MSCLAGNRYPGAVGAMRFEKISFEHFQRSDQCCDGAHVAVMQCMPASISSCIYKVLVHTLPMVTQVFGIVLTARSQMYK